MRDEGKRAAVRKMLRLKKWAGASDREVAREAGVGRYLVRSVRGELIAAGLIPAPEPGPFVPGATAAKLFKPGTVARGGYVFDESGKSVRETVWLARRKKSQARTAARSKGGR